MRHTFQLMNERITCAHLFDFKIILFLDNLPKITLGKYRVWCRGWEFVYHVIRPCIFFFVVIFPNVAWQMVHFLSIMSWKWLLGNSFQHIVYRVIVSRRNICVNCVLFFLFGLLNRCFENWKWKVQMSTWISSKSISRKDFMVQWSS